MDIFDIHLFLGNLSNLTFFMNSLYYKFDFININDYYKKKIPCNLKAAGADVDSVNNKVTIGELVQHLFPRREAVHLQYVMIQVLI